MTDIKPAQNVCNSCKLRKKACDKVLPTCGPCASRQLLCRYSSSASRRRYNPGRYFKQLHSPSLLNGSAQPRAVEQQFLLHESGSHHQPIPFSSLDVFPQSVNESLHQVVRQLSELTKLTCENIIDHYFQGFHKWFPVISPDSVRHEASLYRGEGRIPPADFTALILSMLLIVLPTLESSYRLPFSTQEVIYIAVKSVFSRAQASICASLRLVQAALFIALREYTGIRPTAAYVSITTCTGLARVMEIGKTSLRTTGDKQQSSGSRSDELERENLAWAVAMLERIILCELDQPDLHPQTEYPSWNCRLPSDLIPTNGLPHAQALNLVTLSNLDALDPGNFGREAQSVSLLDRLLLIKRQPPSSKNTKLTELAELDSRIRNFLEVVMSQLEGRQTQISIPVALCVRVLFLLHRSVLDITQYSENDSDIQRREIAWIGLDMACRMILDVAYSHEREKAQIMPICCFYNLQTARKRLEERNNLLKDHKILYDIDTLRHNEEKYRMMWGFQSLGDTVTSH